MSDSGTSRQEEEEEENRGPPIRPIPLRRLRLEKDARDPPR